MPRKPNWNKGKGVAYINCKTCGVKVKTIKSKLGVKKYCSIACRSNFYRKDEDSLWENPKNRRHRIIRKCLCGIEINSAFSQHQRYCSRQCFWENSGKAIKMQSLVICCQDCKKDVIVAAFPNQTDIVATCKDSNLGRPIGYRETRDCLTCGKTMKLIQSLANRKKYCSIACRSIDRIKQGKLKRLSE